MSRPRRRPLTAASAAVRRFTAGCSPPAGIPRLALLALLVPLALFGGALGALGCGDPDARARCAQCGMYADAAPQWTAHATSSGGAALAFDGPKCLFRYAAAHAPDGLRALRVTEYYTQEARPADALLYVRGSDLRSPMGADLVPVEGEAAAAEFARDHGGDVLRYAEITPEVLAALE
ncbi:MAG: nitrous oxide reductase accessory protein NosL [Polyangiales bacterium]|nr:nitrous oxide reductase accessory protein NosL [Sandaracinaceae bacterium]